MSRITVFGGGSWGTALALSAARSGHSVLIWCRREEQAAAINSERRNPDYLQSAELPGTVSATSDAGLAASFSSNWVLALPTQSLRAFLPFIRPLFQPGREICNLAKGIEIGTGARVSEIVDELLPGCEYTVLSGPSFAAEVARGLPTALAAASRRWESARLWQSMLNARTLRVYTSHDVAGVETGGAVKNIMAIASGMALALGLGDNARAALVSRGLAEIMRLGEALGAHPQTLAGLTGMGDLVLTCYSEQSRNFRLGAALGRGLSLEDAQRQVGQTAEGAFTARAVVECAGRLSVDMPISLGVNRLLYEGSSPQEELDRLVSRDAKEEYPPDMMWGSSRAKLPKRERDV